MDHLANLPEVVPAEEYEIIGEVVGWSPDLLKALAMKETMANEENPQDIRFERHVWKRFRFSSRAARRFDRHRNAAGWRKSWRLRRWAAFHEMDRICQEDAFLNRRAADAAILSHSFGWAQIMGFNHKLAGFDRAREFLGAMGTLEGQRQAVIQFILESRPILKAGQREDIETLAYHWNGPKYRRNRWHKDVAHFMAEERMRKNVYV